MYRPIAHDIIKKITGNIRESKSHAGVPLIGASTLYIVISANIVFKYYFTGQN